MQIRVMKAGLIGETAAYLESLDGQVQVVSTPGKGLTLINDAGHRMTVQFTDHGFGMIVEGMPGKEYASSALIEFSNGEARKIEVM